MTKRTQEKLEVIINTQGIGTLLSAIEDICYQKSNGASADKWYKISKVLSHTIETIRLF